METEEQQLLAFVDFWQKYKKIILTSLIMVTLVTCVLRYYNHHNQTLAEEASNIYHKILIATHEKDWVTVKTQGEQLLTFNNKKTPYPRLSAIVLAKMYIEQNNFESAKKSLQWVIEKETKDLLWHIANLRLARILLAERKYEEVNKLLQKDTNNNFKALYNELKGDLLSQQREYAKAKIAYGKALDFVPDDFRQPMLELKHSSVGETEAEDHNNIESQ